MIYTDSSCITSYIILHYIALLIYAWLTLIVFGSSRWDSALKAGLREYICHIGESFNVKCPKIGMLCRIIQ